MARGNWLVAQRVPVARKGCPAPEGQPSGSAVAALAFHVPREPGPAEETRAGSASAAALKRKPVAWVVRQEMQKKAPAVKVMACRKQTGPAKAKARREQMAPADLPRTEAIAA